MRSIVASGNPRRVSILGSTGSIGTTALELIGRFEDRFRVVGLAAGRRVETLKQQIERFRPEVVSLADPQEAAELARSLPADGPRVEHGPEGLIKVAAGTRADILLSALVGAVGLEPTLAAVDAGLAAGFHGGHGADEARSVLGIPDDVILLGIVAVGHPAPDRRSASLDRPRRTDALRRDAW